MSEVTVPLKLSLYPPTRGQGFRCGAVSVGRISGTHLCKAGGGKLGLWLVWPLCLPSSLPVSSCDWVAGSTSQRTACWTTISNHHPFVLILIRSAELPFILVPGDKAFLSLQHIQVKSFVLGVFVRRNWKTSYTELLVHRPFYRPFYNSHCRCVRGRTWTHGPEILSKHPFIQVTLSFLPH